VRAYGRDSVFVHTFPCKTPYIIFIKYVNLEKGLSKKLKKKRTLTQQYFSFHLINKYNKDIDNIFIVVFKSVFMAKARVPLLLRASFTSTEAEQPSIETVSMDLSAYVDPLNGKVLRISKVHFLVEGTNDNRNVATTYTYVSVNAGALTNAVAATTPASANIIMGLNWSYMTFPVPEMGYYVAADTLTFLAQHQLDLEASIRHTCVIECEKVKLPPSDVNFLLVNQTITT